MVAEINKSTFRASLTAGRIFNIQFKPNTTSTVEDIRAGYKAYLKMAEGDPIKVLIEAGKNSYFDVKTNECIKEGELLPTAEAVVTPSLATRLMIDYYLYSRKNKHQVRIFKTRELALEWLDSIQ